MNGYLIIIWDGKPETAERIWKATGEDFEHCSGDPLLFVGEEVLMPGERIVATADVWWMESRRYPRQVEKAEGEKQCTL